MTYTILVADDDAMNREIMEAFLATENYQVHLANNGTTALKMMTALKPDLLILDVLLPDMSGYEVCRHLKTDLLTARIPIMIVTGYDEPEDRQAAKSAGANDFLARPFDPEDFLAHVRALLPHSST